MPVFAHFMLTGPSIGTLPSTDCTEGQIIKQGGHDDPSLTSTVAMSRDDSDSDEMPELRTVGNTDSGTDDEMPGLRPAAIRERQ